MLGFKRELKYYISFFDYQILSRRLKALISSDPNADTNGEYRIRSLYFDDVTDSGLYEKLDGVKYRSKFRIRVYNNSERVIKLEKKIKADDLIRKDVKSLSKGEYDSIIRGDVSFLRRSKNDLLLDFYQKYRGLLLRPKVIVDYYRDAYIARQGHVRITFDKHLRTGLNSTDLFSDTVPLIGVLDDGHMILEIKYDDFLPDYISNAVQIHNRNRFSISKYAMCREYRRPSMGEDG